MHNAIPVMYNQGQPLDTVIPKLMKELEASRDHFDEAALEVQRISNRISPEVREQLAKYMDGLRTIAGGTVEFWYALSC